MGNIDDILKRHAKRLGIERQVEAVGVVEKATEVISKYIPREDFEVVSFKEGILKVATKNTLVANELILQKSSIIKQITEIKTLKTIDLSGYISGTSSS